MSKQRQRRSAHPWDSYAEYQVWRARDAMHLPPEPPPNYSERRREASSTASAGRREDGAQCVHGHRRYQPGCVSCVLVRRDECRRTLVELEAES
jgi:hypothetical protein